MLTTEVGKFFYNHIQHGIYIIFWCYPNFDRLGGDQPADKVGFTFQDPKNIQNRIVEKYYF